MPDLQTQLREYGRQLDEMAPRPSPADVIAASGRAAAHRGFWPDPAWAFGGAFILTFLTIAAIWLLRTGTPAVDVVEESATPIEVGSLEWTRRPIGEVFGTGAEVAAATPGGPGFVAVGHIAEVAAAWTSPDALTWTRVPHDPEVFGRSEINDVTVGGPGLVAAGQHEVGEGALAPAVWTSPDGSSWSRATILEKTSDTDDDQRSRWMTSVVAGGPGLVAVGSEHITLEGTWNFSTVGRVWTSPDGFTWTQVPHDPEIFGRAASYATRSSMNRVIAGGPGLVAIGELDGDAAIWISTDGLAWTPIIDGLTWTSTVIDGGSIRDVTTGGPGLVAVGGYELDPTCKAGTPLDCYAAVWTSPDGITWHRVPHDDAVFGGGPDKQGMSSVATIGTDLVAVGSGVWMSADGIAWTKVYHDPDFVTGEHSGMEHVVASDGTLIVFGEADPDDDYIYLATQRASE